MCFYDYGLRKQRQQHIPESNTGTDAIANADTNTDSDANTNSHAHAIAGRRDDFHHHVLRGITEIADRAPRLARHVHQQRHARA